MITDVNQLSFDKKGFCNTESYDLYGRVSIDIVRPGIRHNNLLYKWNDTTKTARQLIAQLGKTHKHSLGMAIKMGRTNKAIKKFDEIAHFHLVGPNDIPVISIYEDDNYELLFSKVEKSIKNIEKDCTWSRLL